MKNKMKDAVCLLKWRVICPACSRWRVGETAEEAERKFAEHLEAEHPNLSTSVRAIRDVRPIRQDRRPVDIG